jgi:hypothetical protein
MPAEFLKTWPRSLARHRPGFFEETGFGAMVRLSLILRERAMPTFGQFDCIKMRDDDEKAIVMLPHP